MDRIRNEYTRFNVKIPSITKTMRGNRVNRMICFDYAAIQGELK